MRFRYLLMLAGLVCGVSAHAQYSIDWYSINGGGGTSTGGVYSITGTIGQPDAGIMSGGSYSLVGGFWSIISAIATPGAPTLKLTRISNSAVLISWPSPSTGYVLQQNGDLAAGNWIATPQTATDNGVTKSVVVSPPLGNIFYRLKK